MSFCPREGAELETLSMAAASVGSCPMCRGLWVEERDVERVVGAPVVRRAAGVALPGLDAGTEEIGPRCPTCERPMRTEEVGTSARREVHACASCARVWLDAGVVSALRATARTETAPPPAPVEEEPPRRTVFSPPPLVELAALPVMLVVTWLFTATSLGDMIALFPRIQFHELGHALVAWTSGRKALPLPCGLTFWSYERSWLLVLCELTFFALLVVVGVQRRSKLAVATGIAVLSVLGVGLLFPLERSEEWLVAGGCFGEIVLPAAAMAAFHLHLPARTRWDFWRWPLALVGALALASVARMWWEIQAGTRPLPLGSFLGGASSPDGDLDRLLRDHGWSEPGLRAYYGNLASAAVSGMLLLHAVLSGTRALASRTARPGTPEQV